MSILSRIFNRNARKSNELYGASIYNQSRIIPSYRRPVTAATISEILKVPKVLSSITTLSRLCFPGFDYNIIALDENDDTQSENILQVSKKLKELDQKIGIFGRHAKVSMIDLLRRTMLDTLCYRQAIFEYVYEKDSDGWLVPKVQHLPAISFSQSAAGLIGNSRYAQDYLLPGIIYDVNTKQIRFFQKVSSYDEPKELDSEQILYIEDVAMPADTSMVASLVPVVMQWQELRKNLMLASHRIGVPNEIAQIELPSENGSVVNISDLINYAKDLVTNQSGETAKVSLPGMKLEYPNISMPLNPIDPDQYLKREIIEHFFARDILEVTTQAISASSAPGKLLLDQIVAGYREVNGKPWESFINNWLEINGFELKCEFLYWDITPKDQAAERKHMLDSLKAGSMLINEYRRLNGLREYTDEELERLFNERNRLKTASNI